MKMSNTQQRRVILEELRKLDTHPTADELYDLVRQRLPQISLGTVYRNLELLSATSQILKLQLTGTQKRFDGNTALHYHRRCPCCGRVSDLKGEEMAEVERVLNELLRKTGCRSYTLELCGVCPACRKQQSSSRENPENINNPKSHQENKNDGIERQ
ncbi:MAG: transcriptional repressor [Victivallales bacterium]|nr:transcriptional repressor [Victivallales bacterium]